MNTPQSLVPAAERQADAFWLLGIFFEGNQLELPTLTTVWELIAKFTDLPIVFTV